MKYCLCPRVATFGSGEIAPAPHIGRGGNALQKFPLIALVLALSAGGVAVADTYNATETPHYTVEATDGAVELRDYAPRLMAEVTVGGTQSQAVSAGFSILAGYIFGGNEGAAKVAMTTQVAQAPAEKIA
jgi:hypothetical protein